MSKLPLLDKAMKFAFEKHQGQYRKGTDIPYFNHLSDVVSRVAHYLLLIPESRLSATKDSILAAAVLHDVIEDCGVTYEEVLGLFGKNVADMVLECSRAEGHESKLQKYQFLESFSSKFLASILIKVSDRYCNVHDYFRTPDKKVYASTYALQAFPLYLAFWSRLGNHEFGYDSPFKLVLEDIKALESIVGEVYNVKISNFNNNKDELKKLVL